MFDGSDRDAIFLNVGRTREGKQGLLAHFVALIVCHAASEIESPSAALTQIKLL